jgi:hypothetical protein
MYLYKLQFRGNGSVFFYIFCIRQILKIKWDYREGSMFVICRHQESPWIRITVLWCMYRVSCTTYYPYQQLHNTHTHTHKYMYVCIYIHIHILITVLTLNKILFIYIYICECVCVRITHWFTGEAYWALSLSFFRNSYRLLSYSFTVSIMHTYSTAVVVSGAAGHYCCFPFTLISSGGRRKYILVFHYVMVVLNTEVQR